MVSATRRSGDWAAKAALVMLGVGTLVVLAWLMRIASGAGYPFNSSLSSAPNGTALLFEVLRNSGRFASVERNYLPADQFHPTQSVVFYLGLTAYGLAQTKDPVLVRYEEMARSGNRVMLGVESGLFRVGQFVIDRSGAKGDREVMVLKRWDLTVRRQTGKKNDDITYQIFFGPEWRQLDGLDVWERPFGSGAVRIVNRDSRLSNKDLAQNDSSRTLVAALASGRRAVWFDEAHLGVVETGSIAGLLRRYRLGGAVAGCLLLTAFVLWRNAARFPPAFLEEQDEDTVVSGGDAHSTMADLLSRHIARGQLINVCVAEWNRVQPRRRLDAQAWRERDPVSAYREIAAELNPKRVRQS